MLYDLFYMRTISILMQLWSSFQVLMIGAGCFFENKHCTKLADECEVKLISRAPLSSWLEFLSLWFKIFIFTMAVGLYIYINGEGGLCYYVNYWLLRHMDRPTPTPPPNLIQNLECGWFQIHGIIYIYINRSKTLQLGYLPFVLQTYNWSLNVYATSFLFFMMDVHHHAKSFRPNQHMISFYFIPQITWNWFKWKMKAENIVGSHIRAFK